jgi:hypothetical protein
MDTRWGALSGSTRMRFAAHRLGSEFPRTVSLRAHSHDPHSLCDVSAVLLSVIAIGSALARSAYELALPVFLLLTSSR